MKKAVAIRMLLLLAIAALAIVLDDARAMTLAKLPILAGKSPNINQGKVL